MSIATRLLQELATALGTTALELNTDSLVGLTFDEQDVFLYWLEDEAAFLFCSPLNLPSGLDSLDAQRSFYRALLRRNHLMVGASHAVIGLFDDDGPLTLTAYWPTEEKDDAGQLGEALLRFVGDVRALARELDEWHTDAVRDDFSTESTRSGIAPHQFI